MGTDTVADIVQQWRVQRPDLDPSPLLVVGRILRLGQLMDGALAPLFAQAGLGNGEFNILAALRRAGAPYTRSPSELRDSLLVTGGAITKQVDRLEGKGLVTRERAAHDARSRTITLTPAGVELVDNLMARHLDRQTDLLSSLPPRRQAQLASLLAALAGSLEHPGS